MKMHASNFSKCNEDLILLLKAFSFHIQLSKIDIKYKPLDLLYFNTKIKNTIRFSSNKKDI